jgi:hypothetical protein
LCSGPAHARESSVPLIPEPGDAVTQARSTRAIGIGLFAGGLAVTLASQILTGIAVSEMICLNAHDGGCFTGSEAGNTPFVVSAAVSTVAGNAMLATGLALWGIGNHRSKLLRTVGTVGLAPTQGGGSASITLRF